ncbi:SAM-dependent methyltransferase [Frankia sp. CNm7]|uniref:SAM-dependent methyltransferase n=2 Tax=Frankia nepalensis TaxID=1836974 RepID=A0A937UP46_9ACTN|nr:SAM-dependent methyltransferase [Frankia nepalensis]MBL7515087.1 SAM-dependent methyltransferase [Frankia nepalensis]MBL7522292.1 SAM-dependent methyltransferase [Frankia nepalensis]MBL7626895.1 SAM-dependent methyltransferase [Frankia nepalensis]
MYDYFLGGKNNFPADRAAAEQVLRVAPSVRVWARENRAFLHRAARYAAHAGVDQYLDVGTGFPAAPNLHEIARKTTPAARVVYVDNDPLVSVHARALLTSPPDGRTAYVEADLRSPEAILSSEELGATLDLSRAVVLSLVAVLHFLPDDDDPAGVVRRLVDALAPGSCLILSHGTGDFAPEAARRGAEIYRERGIAVQARSKAEIAALVPAGMALVEPGVVPIHRWRPDAGSGEYGDTEIGVYGLVARKL